MQIDPKSRIVPMLPPDWDAAALDVRVREIVILCVSCLRQPEYELVQHLILGRRAGLSGGRGVRRRRLLPDRRRWIHR